MSPKPLAAPEAGRRPLAPLTWQVISQAVAQLLLVGAVGLWLKLLLLVIAPALVSTPGGLVAFVLDCLLAFVLALGCATAAPIFLSSLVPATPANNVLSWLSAKYGGAGYWFAAGCAFVFTAAELWLVSVFWRSKPAFMPGGMFADSWPTLAAFTGITVILFVGLTAWALNRLTPSQLIAAMAESVNAAEILRAEQLKDMQFQITYAYGVSLLKADLLNMGVEKFRQLSGEFVAIVADMEQHEATAFRNMAELLEATGLGEDMFTLVYGQNDAARERQRQLMQAMRNAAEYHREIAAYSQQEAAQLAPPHMSSAALPAPAADTMIDVTATMQARSRERQSVAPNVPAAAQSQETSAIAHVAATLERLAAGGQSPPAADQGGPDVTLNVLAATFGRGMFNAAMIAESLGVSQRSAERLIEEWRKSEWIAACKIRGMYALNRTKEVVNAVAESH